MLFSYFKKEINPKSQPYFLVGFGKTRAPGETGFGNAALWLKICWIGDSNNPLIFITLDTLYFSKNMTEKIMEQLYLEYKLKREQIIFNASHTHSAPNISIDWDALNEPYMAKVEAEIYNGVRYCFDHLEEGYISFEQIVPDKDLFINRRKKVNNLFGDKSVHRLPNPHARIDKNIRTIVLYNSKKEPKVLIYNFGCHPVFNRNENYSSDFPGVISAKLENKVEMAMFLQGFAGDVRTNYYGKVNLETFNQLLSEKKYLKRNMLIFAKLLWYRSMFIPYSTKHFIQFTDTVTELVNTSINSANSVSEIKITSSAFPFTLSSSTGKISKTFSTNIVSLNGNIFVSIPAEVNSCYYFLLNSLVKKGLFFPLGYGYDMISYLPGSTEIKEKGYEVESYANYGFDNVLSEEGLAKYEAELVGHVRHQLLS